MIQNEEAAAPIGFTHEDVNLDAPRLFENGFDIMFSRVLKKISMGLYALHLSMSYREDVVKFYKEVTQITQKYYNDFTQYLLEEGILPTPNYVNMPKSVDYINDKNYMKGSNLIGHKRSLNTIEFGYLYQGMETNVSGMQLMAGFSQCAKSEELQKYFMKGKELSKEIIQETEKILLQNDIHPPSTPGGTVTSSTSAPFSQKLMMFTTYLLCNFSLGSQSFNASFSLRNDLTINSGIMTKDVYEYAREGIMIMINNGWLEEPPKMDL
ncbi:hypothetical protein HNR44_003238 [Geomicrobium halophilum]|uniref:DUF3231 family protein n=1 Tax=Geomicrobium halophilum TaxID=549000 RepID=A0A841PTZ5_9BACL|nr:DUF3231 family protein [Geomicrobium halophilum]MBB6451244.1 hypothetical protein [Geomicrobium halophilum]